MLAEISNFSVGRLIKICFSGSLLCISCKWCQELCLLLLCESDVLQAGLPSSHRQYSHFVLVCANITHERTALKIHGFKKVSIHSHTCVHDTHRTLHTHESHTRAHTHVLMQRTHTDGKGEFGRGTCWTRTAGPASITSREQTFDPRSK